MQNSSNFNRCPNKTDLLKCYGGRNIYSLPTPAFIINKDVFALNCEKMLQCCSRINADFRAHVKTHKTVEGTRLQLGSQTYRTDKIVVSTLSEAWGLLPLIEKGIINDVLFSLPVVSSRLDELAEFARVVPHLRIMLDNEKQLHTLNEYSISHPETPKWSIFIKVNVGTNRAGFLKESDSLSQTLTECSSEKIKKNIIIYGFYAHAGHSYSSNSIQMAKDFLIEEINGVNKAAKIALTIDPSLRKLQLSVGSTPTAHATAYLSRNEIIDLIDDDLHGNLEIHAGNYPFCDLQQISTNAVTLEDVSCRVLAEVISIYDKRGEKMPGEHLINAGVLAIGREFGPFPGHGRIVFPEKYNGWIIGRLSQEHGICTPLSNSGAEKIPLNTVVGIVPQHSCITAAAYPWYYVTDSSNQVIDIWLPCRGW